MGFEVRVVTFEGVENIVSKKGLEGQESVGGMGSQIVVAAIRIRSDSERG